MAKVILKVPKLDQANQFYFQNLIQEQLFLDYLEIQYQQRRALDFLFYRLYLIQLVIMEIILLKQN